jgi:beta-lactamase class A
MKNRTLWRILGVLGILFLLSSLTISLVEYNRFKSRPITFPSGSTIANLPVGGLNAETAEEQVRDYYALPLVLEINGSLIKADPEDLGFNIRASEIVDDAVQKINVGNFWDYLWGRPTVQPIQVPLAAQVSEDTLTNYLNNEIVPRYTQPGMPIQPIPGTTNFSGSDGGETLDMDRAIADISTGLMSHDIHSVTLHTIAISNPTPDSEMLQAFLQHQIKWAGFENLVEVYLQSMETGQTLQFAVNDDALVAPDVAFTAASTIKIPIMISVLRRTEEPTPDDVVNLLERMIAYSENPPADTLMSTYLDEVRGPMVVSEDLAALGMENSFLAGYFYLGAPVLGIFETPANSRTDIFLDPDIYNQTVPSEAGELLAGIYTCAADGTGLLTQTFPGEITQSECQLMIDTLLANKIGLLIEGGLGPEASAAHKHGWVQELDGLLHSMSDVAIVFTPGGDYVLCLFIYDPDRLDFDQGNLLVTRLSQTVYNFFNLENQQYWWFD